MKKLTIEELQKIIRESISEEVKKEGWGSVRRARGRGLDDDQYESPEDFAPDDGDTKIDHESGERLVWSGEIGRWIEESEWDQMNLAKRSREESEEDLDETASVSSVDGKNTTLMPESHRRFLGEAHHLEPWQMNQTAEDAKKRVNSAMFGSLSKNVRHEEPTIEYLTALQMAVTKWAREIAEHNAIAARKRVDLGEQAQGNETSIKEHDRAKTMTFGQIPPTEELESLMNGEDFKMNLRGTDSLAFEYATRLSLDPLAGSMAAGKGMEATLQALVNAPSPSELSDEQYAEVEDILDRWFHASPRYHEDYSIEDASWSLASSIMQVLGIEWV